MSKLFFLVFFFCYFYFALAQKADLKALKTINQTDLPKWDKAMKNLSFTAYPIAPASVSGILFHGYFKKDKVLIRNGYKSTIALVLAMGISTGTKYLFQRMRPAIKYPNDIVARDHSSTYSFPSGHTTAAFATATALTLTYNKWYVAVPAYTYASFIGYSRMRLGMHYPTDVLGGIIAGIGSGLLTWKLDHILKRK